MPKTGMSQEFEMETRDRFTKVKTELSILVDGKELPNMGVLGSALEEAIELVRNKIKESYVKVPERVDTPMDDGLSKKPVEAATVEKVFPMPGDRVLPPKQA